MKDLVRCCLYNWLGYGNINAPVWFIGMEEGGAEIWRQATRSLQETLELRSTYCPAMDFRDVREDKYGIPLESFRGITVWHYMTAFLLSLRGVQPDSSRIREFLFGTKQLGARGSDYSLSELLPLPRKSHDSMEGYDLVWDSVDAYKKELMPKRFAIITDTLQHNPNVRLLVSYDKSFTAEALSYYPSHMVKEWSYARQKPYRLYSLHVDEDRHVHLLSTPFFGQGQCSYEGLQFAAKEVRSLLEV